MITLLLHLLQLLPFLCGGHRQLALENLALHQQLAVYQKMVIRPKLCNGDRRATPEAPGGSSAFDRALSVNFPG